MLPFFACIFGLTWSVQHDPFFWDTVQLASKHAHFFYENGLNWLPLPEEIDSGHPPVFGYYLAHNWLFFGKTLPVSHWAMLPFLLLNVWLLYRLGERLGGEKWAFWLIPLAFLDPVMAGQSVLVSPDIVLVCGFLLAVEGILARNRIFTAVGALLLCMISMRGMMTTGALFVWQFLSLLRRNRIAMTHFSARVWAKELVGSAFLFLPGFAFAIWFLWWHRTTTGWSGFHPNSPWSPAFEPVEGAEMLRNLLVVGWRWLDFGRIFEWLALGWLIWKNWPVKNANSTLSDLLLLVGCLLVFLSPSALFFKNISAHRYFLPGFLALHFLVFYTLANASWLLKLKKEWLFGMLITSFALGNLWIYPRSISMGWDATLAHLPYHTLRAEAVVFFQKNNIDFQKVGSFFPNLNTGENLSLDGDPGHFGEKDFLRNEYVVASNVFNDLTETDYLILHRGWILLKKWKHAGVWMEIYQRPDKLHHVF